MKQLLLLKTNKVYFESKKAGYDLYPAFFM